MTRTDINNFAKRKEMTQIRATKLKTSRLKCTKHAQQERNATTDTSKLAKDPQARKYSRNTQIIMPHAKFLPAVEFREAASESE